MSPPLRLWALVCAIAYALRRTKVAFFTLHQAVTVGCLLAAALAVYRGWTLGFTSGRVLLVLTALAITVSLLWADTRRYVTFRAHAFKVPESTANLLPAQKIFARASGTFAVNEMERHLVEVPVVFWSTELGEHILAARVRAFSLFGVGVPSGERGWWYVFLEPKRIREIVAGEVAFGLRLRPAVRVLRETDKGLAEVYVSCDSTQELSVLLKEMRSRAAASV